MERPTIRVGELLSRAAPLYRTYFRVLIPIALAVFGTLVVVNAALILVTLAFVEVAASIAGGILLQIVFAVIGSTLAAPIVALVTAILYFELVELKGRAPAARFTDF